MRITVLLTSMVLLLGCGDTDEPTGAIGEPSLATAAGIPTNASMVFGAEPGAHGTAFPPATPTTTTTTR